MCDADQHAQYMAALARIEQLNTLLIFGRPAIDQFYSVSSTQGFMLDYKNRKHIYIFSPSQITLDLGVLGKFAINANIWTNIDFQQNTEIISTSSPIISVLIRATDDAYFASSSIVEYMDGSIPPTNPIGNTIIFDNSGVWVDVGADHPLPTSAASLPLPANAAQEAGGHLASIDTNIPAKGTAAMAASQPITIASDDTLTTAIKNSVATIATNTATPIAANIRTNNALISAANPLAVNQAGGTNTAIAAGVPTNTVVKASSGRLCYVVVASAGTNAILIYDNATTNSGTIIGAIPSAAALGTYGPFLPASAGITVAGNAGNAAMTVNWS